jgi:hypothetical protein
VHGEVSRLLDRFDGKIAGRVDDDRPLTTDPGNNRGPIFLIMAPTWFAFLAATTRSTPQVLFPSVFGLPLVASGVIEFIGFYGAG